MWPTTSQYRADFVIRMWGVALNILNVYDIFDVPTGVSAQYRQACDQLAQKFESAFINVAWDYIDTRLRWSEGRMPGDLKTYQISDEYHDRWKTMPTRHGFPPCPRIQNLPVGIKTTRATKRPRFENRDLCM